MFNAIGHQILPVSYGILLFLALLLLWRLLRRLGLLHGMHISTRLLALVAGLALGLEYSGLLTSEIGRDVLNFVLVALVTIVTLHIGEQLILLPYRRQGRQPPVPRLMRDILRALLFVVTLLVSISHFFEGVQLGTVLLSSTVFTAVVGLALQDLLKNVIAGLALQLEHPFEAGDWVQVDGQEGQILEMSWRATRLRTRDGFSIIVPNGTIAQQRIFNYTTVTRLQARHLSLPIDSSYPPTRVQEVILRAALEAEGVAAQPAPLVRVQQFSPATTTYDLKYWLTDYDRLPDIESNVMISIWYHLQRYSIPIANTELVLLQPGDVVARRAPPDPATTRDMLQTIDLFSVLSTEELEALACSASIALYGRGEVLMRQGAVEDTLFIIQSGQVRVEVAGTNGEAPLVIKHMGPGKIIGEFGLLTGEPRSATVVAAEDTVAIVIERSHLAPILAGNRALPEMLGKVLARRSAERSERLEARRAAAGEDTGRVGSRSLAGRIRNLFGIS